MVPNVVQDGAVSETQARGAEKTLTEAQKRSRANLRAPWRKGEVANPGGRPATLAEMRAHLTREGGAEVYRTGLLELARGGPDVPPSVRLGAIHELGDRLFGRAEQAVHVTGEVTSALSPFAMLLLEQLQAIPVAADLKEAPSAALPDVVATPEK